MVLLLTDMGLVGALLRALDEVSHKWSGGSLALLVLDATLDVLDKVLDEVLDEVSQKHSHL